MFPGQESLEAVDLDNLSEERPQHIYDALNCQGEQDQEDDKEIEIEAALPYIFLTS